MAIEDVVDTMDTIINIVAFVIMFVLTAWTLFKYRKQKTDNFFIFSLCMYPFSYLLLMVGAVLYLGADNEVEDDQVYAFISNYILPINYLVMWTIELLLCFEMQLMRVRLSNDEPSQCQRKLRMWKTFRFVVLLASTTFNLLQVYVNTLVDFKVILSTDHHSDFQSLPQLTQTIYWFNFSLILICSIVFGVLMISNLEFFMRKFWQARMAIAGLTVQTTLKQLGKENQNHQYLVKMKRNFSYLRFVAWFLIVRELFNCITQLLFALDLCHTLIFYFLNYTNRAFLETTIDTVEFFSLCLLYRAQHSLSSQDEDELISDDLLKDQESNVDGGVMESEASELRDTMEIIRRKKKGINNNKKGAYNTSVNNAASSTAIGSSKGNLMEGDGEEEFDDAMMIKSMQTMSIKQKRQVSGMEGYHSSDEDDEDDDKSLAALQNLEFDNEEPLQESLIRNSAQEGMTLNNIAAKVDLFDGRLEQFNKFLEFIVQPKNSINKAKKTISNSRHVQQKTLMIRKEPTLNIVEQQQQLKQSKW